MVLTCENPRHRMEARILMSKKVRNCAESNQTHHDGIDIPVQA